METQLVVAVISATALCVPALITAVGVLWYQLARARKQGTDERRKGYLDTVTELRSIVAELRIELDRCRHDRVEQQAEIVELRKEIEILKGIVYRIHPEAA